MQKYVVNFRGRAIPVSEKALQHFLDQGYKEITKQQFETKKYYPEWDRGDTHIPSPVPQQKIQSQENTTSERTEFLATVV